MSSAGNEWRAKLAAEDARLPGVTIAARDAAIRPAILINHVVFAETIKRKVIGGIKNRCRILSETIRVLLVGSSLHDKRWRIRYGSLPGEHVNVNRRVALILAA